MGAVKDVIFLFCQKITMLVIFAYLKGLILQNENES